MGPRPPGFAFGHLLVLAGMTGACQSDVALVDPDGAADGPILLVVAADTSLARDLAWPEGVPDAQVHLRRDEVPTGATFLSDSTGHVTTMRMSGGTYWIWSSRQLTVGEQQSVGSRAHVLAGGAYAVLSRGEETGITLKADEPASLVVNEYHYHHPPSDITQEYYNYTYLELANNADTTIYLDGKIIGSGFNYNIDASLWPCLETKPYRQEPRGIYAQFFQVFPGSGREHPVAAGDVVLIADQAIDHSAVVPGLPDLSDADFEFRFQDRADNPSVPDMIDIGLKPITGNRSERFFVLADVVFVADPVEVGSLERVLPKYQGEFALFPTDVLLDVASFYSGYQLVPTAARMCGYIADSSIDALPAVTPFIETPNRHLLSVHRRRDPSSGKLQRTGTTQADFELRSRSPGDR